MPVPVTNLPSGMVFPNAMMAAVRAEAAIDSASSRAFGVKAKDEQTSMLIVPTRGGGEGAAGEIPERAVFSGNALSMFPSPAVTMTPSVPPSAKDWLLWA